MGDTLRLDPPPNPGSDQALAKGCTCPVIDNGHGQRPVSRDEDGRDQWWTTAGCPLHWVAGEPNG